MKKIILAITILSVFTFGCSENKQKTQLAKSQRDPVKVSVAKAKLIKQEKTLEYSGTVEALQTIPLSFESTGTVEAVYVDEGDFVKKGQLLAKVERGSLENAYNGALAKYEQAVDARERLSSVYEKGSLPEIRWVEINSQVDQAKAMMNMSKRNLENCEMYAPASGIIGQRNIEPGMSAIQIKSPLKIVKIEHVLIKISVPENEISLLKKGLPAEITVGALGNKIFTGNIEKVGVVANVLSRTYSVKIKVDNPDYALKPGMVCEVNIALPDKQARLVVPVSSVDKDEARQHYVYVADQATGQAERTTIEICDIFDDHIAVCAGLQQGDLVVTAGNQKITDGSPIIY